MTKYTRSSKRVKQLNIFGQGQWGNPSTLYLSRRLRRLDFPAKGTSRNVQGVPKNRTPVLILQ